MDKKEIADIVMKLYLYGDVCKMIHYSAEKMHCHTLCDDVRESINEFADELAEKAFGHTGKPSFGDFSLKLSISLDDDISVICRNAVDLVEAFRKKIEGDDRCSGIVSIIDDFKSDMAQKVYLATFDNVSDKRLDETIRRVVGEFVNNK